MFFTCINVSLLAGTFIGGQFVSKKLHSMKTYNIGLIILGGATTLAFLGSNSSLFVTICICIANVGFGFSNSVVIAMFNDTAVYGEWKTSRNISGFVVSFYSVAIILASVLVSPIVGAVLSASSYEAGTEVTSAVSFAIRALMTLIPGIIVLLGYVLSRGCYKLDKAAVSQYQAEIDSRT